MSPTCLGQSGMHPHGGALQGIGYIEILQKILKEWADVKC
jgi:hypothetical protein